MFTFVQQHNYESASMYTIPSVSGLKRLVHEGELPHSSVGAFWKYDAGSVQLKVATYSISHIYSVVSSVFMILATKLLQSPVEISFSYTWQVWGHSSRGGSVVSLHGGFTTKQSMCRMSSRQAGGDCVSCARTFSMKNPYSRSVITAASGGICGGLTYSLPLPNTLRQSLDGGSNVQLF